MKKLSLVLCLFVSILAPASSFAFSNNPFSKASEAIDNEENSDDSFHLSTIGFDKVLTILSVKPDSSDIKMEILDKSNHIKYAAQHSFAGVEWTEVDLSRLAAGSYTVRLTSGTHTQVDTIILP